MFDPINRQSGKTTRLILAVVTAMVEGKWALVVTNSPLHAQSLSKRVLALLTELTGSGESLASSTVLSFAPTQARAFFVTEKDLDNLRGLKFDELFSDPGELEPAELTKAMNLMCSNLAAHDVIDVEFTILPLEQNARRTLSSR